MLPTDLWPLAGLRVSTPRLTLSVPDEGQLVELARLAAQGVHAPDVMPFTVPWTDVSPRERARSVLQHQWGSWSSLRPGDWNLALVVQLDDVVAGVQAIGAKDFSVLREATTGSWLGQHHQGQGIGTEMRIAVLALAFRRLGARVAHSGAFVDNVASIRVSTKLGYVADGSYNAVRRGEPAESVRFVMTREMWNRSEAARRDVVIEGLEPCRAELGAP